MERCVCGKCAISVLLRAYINSRGVKRAAAKNAQLIDNSATKQTKKRRSAPATAAPSTTGDTHNNSQRTRMGACFGRCIAQEPNAAHNLTSCLWRQPIDEQEAELITNNNESGKKDKFIFRIIKFKRRQKRRQFIDKFWERQDRNYAKLTNGNATDSSSDIQLQHLDVYNLLNTTANARESSSIIHPRHNAFPSSRASSSLDLEWEHEYTHLRHYTAHSTNAQAQAPTLLPATHDNQHMQQLSDSWQFLTNDDDQFSSMKGSEDDSLPPMETATTTNIRAAHGLTRSAHGKQSHLQQPPRNGSFTRTSSHNSWSHISTPESLEWDIDEDQQRQLRMEDDNLDHETLQLLHQIEQLKNQVLNETGDGLLEAAGGGSGRMEFSSTAGAEAMDIS